MPFAASETLSLTTIHQPVDRMATQCIDCLIARIQDPDGPGTRVLLAPHLVTRRYRNHEFPGGTLEVAQRIAGDADRRTTKLYERRGQRVLLEDMERIRY